MSACGLSLMVAMVGRIAPGDRRTTWLGINRRRRQRWASSSSSPAVQATIAAFDWRGALVAMALAMFAAIPVALSLRAGTASALAKPSQQSPRRGTARGCRSPRLCHAGLRPIFVCGLQVQFIATHLPAYLTDAGLPAALGAAAIATIGLFNLFGTLIAGRLGDRYRVKFLLSGIYIIRSLVMLAFLSAPLSETSVIIFAAAMGLLWLSTVPLTMGLIAHVFGRATWATLGAVAFLSHQVGSFLGVWLGGRAFDLTGSYDPVWAFAIFAGLAATLIHLPIPDRPLARLAGRAA